MRSPCSDAENEDTLPLDSHDASMCVSSGSDATTKKELLQATLDDGVDALLRRDLGAAWHFFTRALELDPNNESAMTNLSLLRQRMSGADLEKPT